MACFSKTQPADINYGNQLSSTLNAQAGVADQQLGLEQKYQPQYAQLALQNYNTLSSGMNQSALSNLDAARSYTGQLSDTVRSINPQSQALLSELNSQVYGDLQAGSSLNDAQTRQAQQASRAAASARGVSGGNSALFDEVYKQYDMGRQLQTQRQSAAGATLGLNQSQVDNPTLQLLGQYMNAANNSSAGANQLMTQAGPSLFNPESALSAQIAAGNQQNAALFSSSTADKAGNAIAPLNSAAASY